MVVGSLLVALTLTQAAPQAQQTGRISGRVTLDGANTPVSGARITLIRMARPAAPLGPPSQTTTDQDGRFGFERLEPGTYRLDAQKTGLAPVDASRAPTVTITAGQSMDGVSLLLQRGAVITGKVLDAAGEPLTDVRVVVLRRMPMPPGAAARGLPTMPRLVPVPTPGAQTNDLGEYRIAGLAAGEYFVAASPRSVGMLGATGSSPARDQKKVHTTLPTTYYPGTSDQAAAQPIAVAAGAEVGNIFLTLRPVPAYRVSGVVVDEDGKPVADAMVMLVADPRSGVMMGPVGNSVSQPNGQFDIDDVPSGSYRANASIVMRMTGSAGGGVIGGVSSGIAGSGGGLSWSSASTTGGATAAPAEIVVADADVTNVKVVVRRPTSR